MGRSGPYPRRVHGDYRVSPQARDAAASGGSTEPAFIVIWEASDRVCSERLRPVVPVLVEAMERHGHLRLAPEVRISLLAMSAATIDRSLRDIRQQAGRLMRRKGPPSAAVRRSVPVARLTAGTIRHLDLSRRTWSRIAGRRRRAVSCKTLMLTDIATGWTECAPLLVREQRLLTEVLSEMRTLMPFALLGLVTDNDSVFMSETVRDYCLAAGVEFTRCRPYRKNDQAWVEQKNGSVVRRAVGYRRFEGLATAAVLARLYVLAETRSDRRCCCLSL
jgi:hypothetical protein